MSRAEIGASGARLSRGWHENEVKKRRQEKRDKRWKNRWRGERKAEWMAQKLGENERKRAER